MAASSAARRPKNSHEPLIVLERFLPYRLNVLATVVSNALAQIYSERFSLTIPAWRVIATLGQYGVRTARDIAAHAVMHKSTVSRAVSGLEARGLVARQPNPDDKREELLGLTGEGRRIYAALAPEALAFEQKLAAGLSPAEQATLFTLVERLDIHARALAETLGAETPLTAETPA
ncbi:MAG TPA: MarR family transcriptional regulator [Beijerinckiaceae bacterium]|jgi:DNA-binding MarR family transcriptional regulator|nr:MarR family transcriptional regulator [Beijerinckiaceae bacterium]